jgi:hypothetical protein
MTCDTCGREEWSGAGWPEAGLCIRASLSSNAANMGASLTCYRLGYEREKALRTEVERLAKEGEKLHAAWERAESARQCAHDELQCPGGSRGHFCGLCDTEVYAGAAEVRR